MAVRRVTSEETIKDAIAQYIERARMVIIRNLAYVGEQVVNVARSLPSPPASMAGKPHKPHYIDWTANLRSSIGYVIAEDGNIVTASSFEPEKGGEEGARTGKAFAERLAREHDKGFALVVVAGMEYAVYVSNKGYDVLDSAELTAQRLVPEMTRQLKLI